MRFPTRLIPIIVVAVASLAIVGCSVFNATAPVQDPAKAAAIHNRQALVDARAFYSATERMIVSLHASNKISTARAQSLVVEMQKVVHPTLDAAQDALVAGDFDAALLKFTTAIAGVTSKLPATASITPSTQPTLYMIPRSAPPVHKPEPFQASAVAAGVAMGLIELMQLYNRKKAEAAAAGEGDDARLAELDQQVKNLANDNNAADAAADAALGLPPPQPE